MISTKLGSYIDVTWEPSFVNEVKEHILRSKVTWGQVVRQAENGIKSLIWKFEKLEAQVEPDSVYRYNMGTLIISQGQRSYIRVF